MVWATTTPLANFFLSSITVQELDTLLLERKDATQGAVLRAWIDKQVLPRFEGRIFAVDVAVAQRCASYRSQTRPAPNAPSRQV